MPGWAEGPGGGALARAIGAAFARAAEPDQRRATEPNETPCSRCGARVGWGRQTPFGIYDEASALMNHIETEHPEVDL